jgi:translation initiation factor IF-1|tara:strand:+ start:261 stop:488 length:228 start_codon:yes stop_codon:yes gene_type:complete
MSKKANVIEAKGTIFKESGNGYFNVELDEPEDHKCLCRASGRLITRKIQLLVGDRVTVELSPFDLSRGRITLREK